MTLRRLPEGLINRIAAGEVVERPASVVKELVENAIDAGARAIEVVVRDGGATLIEVADDGCGMDRDELVLAVERHATSKLPGDDLSAIATLGFRGEALPAIGAVSRLTLTSRRCGAEHAWALTVEGGRKGEPQPAAQPPGTRIVVRDLFFATPARLKFLKAPATETGHIVDAMHRLALAHPEIGFTLSDGSRALLRAPAGSGDAADRLLQRAERILGSEFAANAVAIAAERDGIALFGYAGLPTLNRRQPTMQFLIVNGRPIRDKIVYGAVRAAYQDVLASDRYPMLVLFLTLAVEDVDVNVHPMKTEVRFRDAARVRGLLVGALKRAIGEHGHRVADTAAAALLAAADADAGASAGAGTGADAGSRAWPATGSLGSARPALRQTSLNLRWPQAQGLAEAATAWQGPAAAPSPRPEQQDAGDDATALPLGRACAQVHATFIVAETADGLVIVDQHAAHERIVHERLLADLNRGSAPRQGLLIPEVVELDPAAAGRLLAAAADLERLGLVFEPFGLGAVLVREVPALLGEIDVKGLLRDLADDLAELDGGLVLDQRLSRLIASLACHGSVRAGRKLSHAEMDALLRAMESTPRSGQCSHGRPTHVELKRADIERLFGRR